MPEKTVSEEENSADAGQFGSPGKRFSYRGGTTAQKQAQTSVLAGQNGGKIIIRYLRPFLQGKLEEVGQIGAKGSTFSHRGARRAQKQGQTATKRGRKSHDADSSRSVVTGGIQEKSVSADRRALTGTSEASGDRKIQGDGGR